MHFELSERKFLLRLVDLIVVLGSLYLMTAVFHFTYFEFSKDTFYRPTVFSVYFFNLDSADAVLYEFPKILTILE